MPLAYFITDTSLEAQGPKSYVCVFPVYGHFNDHCMKINYVTIFSSSSRRASKHASIPFWTAMLLSKSSKLVSLQFQITINSEL